MTFHGLPWPSLIFYHLLRPLMNSTMSSPSPSFKSQIQVPYPSPESKSRIQSPKSRGKGMGLGLTLQSYWFHDYMIFIINVKFLKYQPTQPIKNINKTSYNYLSILNTALSIFYFRNVEHNYSRGHSARNSISLAGYYACDSNSTFLSASRRNSFMR